MKNMESFPPLKTIELANKKLPEIWAAIEKTRADMLSTDHHPWREDIYIPAWQIYEHILLNGPYYVPLEARPRGLAVTLSMLASNVSEKLKDDGIDGMDKVFDLNDDMEDIDEALDEEFPGGDVLAVEYTPFNGNGINYTGNDRYYLKPNDVKLSILEEGHNGYTGQYIAVLSKDMQGDPMEIKVLWYYKQ